MLADTFLRPALPPAELEVARERQLSSLSHEQDNPDAILGLRSHEVLYRGHPFANRQIGTVEKLDKDYGVCIAVPANRSACPGPGGNMGGINFPHPAPGGRKDMKL